MDECHNCEERECVDGGALCDECREQMWEGQHTHHGNLDSRTIEDISRANGATSPDGR